MAWHRARYSAIVPRTRTLIETVSEWDDPDIRAVLADLARDQPTPAMDAIIYRGRNLLWRMVVAGESVAVKRFRTRGWWAKLSYRLRSGKARRSFHNAQELIRRGIPTPAPRALIEVWRGGWLHEAYYLCADLGPAPQIRRVLLDTDFADREGHCTRLATMLAGMHAAGIWHRDMTAGNVLLVETATGWTYHLVDLNRLRFGPVRPARGVANLAKLEARDELRDALLRGYCQARDFDLNRARRRYEAAFRRHRRHWAIKKGTRRWRRWLFARDDDGGR